MEFRQILDLVPQLVSVYGPAGERLYANRIGLDYVGLSFEEWQQRPGTIFSSASFFHPDDREHQVDGYERAGALDGRVLAKASLVGTYSLNPRLQQG